MIKTKLFFFSCFLFLIVNVYAIDGSNDISKIEGNWKFEQLQLIQDKDTNVITYKDINESPVSESIFSTVIFKGSECILFNYLGEVIESGYEIINDKIQFNYFSPYLEYNWEIDKDEKLNLKFNYLMNDSKNNMLHYFLIVSYSKS